jgi:membrane protease YdiL (CAAX protease family)
LPPASRAGASRTAPAPAPAPLTAPVAAPVAAADARRGGAHAGPALAAYVAGCFAAAALTAPAVWMAMQAAADAAPALAPLGRQPVYRILHRLLLVFGVLGLPALLRALGMRSWRDVGLARPWAHRRDVALGAALGVAAIAAAGALPLAVGARALKDDITAGGLAVRALGALGAALAVAPLEELLFRGVVFGGLRRWRAPGARAAAVALVASSAFYALVHFFTRPPAPRAVGWDSGFALLGGMLAGFADLKTLVPQFFTLFVVGACLAALYRRTGALWASVGAHAGGIFMLKTYSFAVANSPRDADPWLWGTGRLVDGWVALLAVLLAALGGGAALRRRAGARPSPAPPGAA